MNLFVCSFAMGLFDKLAYSLGFKKREASVLVIGIDNAGKSTVINHFKMEDEKTQNLVPTVGYNVEKFKSKYVNLLLLLMVLFYLFIQ